MRKGIVYLPAILLVVLALTQIVLANFYHLSPWLGGGYGMFSTTDVGRNRHIHIYAYSPGIKTELLYPSELDDLVLRTKSFPTVSNLKILAHKISDIENDSNLETIEVQVWKSEYSADSLTPSGSILKSYKLELGQ